MSAISPLDFDELDPALQEALRPRYERLGYLGDFFRVMGRQPRALAAFDAFTEECKSALGPRLAEAVALTVATRVGNDYERTQHERLAVRSGLGRQWVSEVEALRPDDDGRALDDDVRAVQRFALAAVGGGDAPRTLAALVAATDETTATAVVLLTARFAAHALISSACALRPMVPSIFEDGFDG